LRRVKYNRLWSPPAPKPPPFPPADDWFKPKPDKVKPDVSKIKNLIREINIDLPWKPTNKKNKVTGFAFGTTATVCKPGTEYTVSEVADMTRAYEEGESAINPETYFSVFEESAELEVVTYEEQYRLEKQMMMEKEKMMMEEYDAMYKDEMGHGNDVGGHGKYYKRSLRADLEYRHSVQKMTLEDEYFSHYEQDLVGTSQENYYSVWEADPLGKYTSKLRVSYDKLYDPTYSRPVYEPPPPIVCAKEDQITVDVAGAALETSAVGLTKVEDKLQGQRGDRVPIASWGVFDQFDYE